MAEIMSAEDFLVVCKKWDWDDSEFADELRSRDKAIVERCYKAVLDWNFETNILGNDCEMKDKFDDVLRDLGIE